MDSFRAKNSLLYVGFYWLAGWLKSYKIEVQIFTIKRVILREQS